MLPKLAPVLARVRWIACVAWVAWLACAPMACGGNAGDGSETVVLAGRNVTTRPPDGWDGLSPLPLVVGIHGWGNDPATLRGWLALEAQADAHGALLAFPEATVGADGKRFWNATDACCDFGHTGVDDLGFFGKLLDELEARWPIDPRRVWVVGHSNGAFMAHRLACDMSDRIAGIVSIEGATYADPSLCHATSPVPVVEVHGTADFPVVYGGGSILPGAPPFPGAEQTVATWAHFDACAGALPDTGQPLTIDSEPGAGDERALAYPGCRADVALWKIDGGTHSPVLTDQFRSDLFDFLVRHPKR
jgi:polyhydroxybutyrate depolymerase